MSTVSAYAATSATEPLTKTTIARREPGPHDVAFDIKFAGICHSDIHTVKAEWGVPNYPVVPGHEIAGVVTEVGSEVTKYQVGDRVGVGCMVDSCRECSNCQAGNEQYCKPGADLHLQLDRQRRPADPGRLQPGDRRRRELRAAHTRRACRWTPRLRCCARASRCTRRCGTGTPGQDTESRSSAWAGSAIWASSWRAAMGAEVTVL